MKANQAPVRSSCSIMARSSRARRTKCCTVRQRPPVHAFQTSITSA
jgi:hypothetical protein